MGFFGIGLRSVGSRHLKDNAIVTAKVAADAITSAKVAPDTIIAIDIADNAIGSREIADGAVVTDSIAANAVTATKVIADAIGSKHLDDDAISYASQIKDDIIGSHHLGNNALSYAAQIKDNIIGSSKLGPDSVYRVKIADGAVGSSELDTDSVYSVKVKNNTVGYAKCTTGLQGSFGEIGTHSISEDKFQLHFEHGRIGTIPSRQTLTGSIETNIPYLEGITFATDKGRLWVSKLGIGIGSYIFEIGTTLENIIGSIHGLSGYHVMGLAYAPDNHRMWAAGFGAASQYIFEIGTTTGDEIGSIASPFTNVNRRLVDLAFATDKNRLWLLDWDDPQVKEIGTTTGSVYTTWDPPTIGENTRGLAYDPVTHRLYSQSYGNQKIYELGTASGAIIGSFAAPTTNVRGLTFTTDKRRLWSADESSKYAYEIYTKHGTHIPFSQPFGVKPTLVVSPLADNIIYTDEPSTGSFNIKSSKYIQDNKAMWMAWGSRA